MTNLKCIALDLDGTLTNSEKKITEKTKQALFRCMDKGVKVLLASGRPPLGVWPLARELELDKRGGYILSFNGACVYDCATGEKIVDVCVPAECFRYICDIDKLFPEVGVIGYAPENMLTTKPENEYVQYEVFCNSAVMEGVTDLFDVVEGTSQNKFLAAGTPAALPPVKEYVDAKYKDVLDTFLSCEFFLEIMPKGVGKDWGLAQVLEKLGMTRDELIAFGDAPNDTSMLKFAGVGVAMANAFDEVKEIADFITLSNDEDGVAYALDKFIP